MLKLKMKRVAGHSGFFVLLNMLVSFAQLPFDFVVLVISRQAYDGQTHVGDTIFYLVD